MKHFLLCLSTLILTFLAGLAVASTFLFFTQIPNVEAISAVQTKAADRISGIEIDYKWTLKAKDFNTGIFVVTNNTDQSIYYAGYEKNNHVDNWIRQNNRVAAATELICRMGLEEQELKPNESALFEITVPHNKKPFEAGFEFYAGDNREPKTIWVRVNKQAEFVAVETKSESKD